MPITPDLRKDVAEAEAEDGLAVRDFLVSYAQALTTNDTAALIAHWETPAFVLSDLTTQVIDRPEEVEQLYADARERYTELGIIDTRPEIVRLDVITDRLVMARVRWPYLDPKGRELGAETSTYTLVREDGGQWKLRVAVSHGKEAVN